MTLTPPQGLVLLQALAGAEKGGAELHFVRLAQAFQRAQVNQHVVMRRHDKALSSLRASGVPITLAPFGGFFDFSTRRILRTVAGALRPTVALSYMSRATKALPRGPYALVARLGGYYDMKYYRHCDHLIGITPDLVDYFVREGWPREHASCIPNFVEDRDPAALTRAAFDTPPEAPLLASVGRLHQNKAFDTLLHALTLIPGAYLWIGGEGPERAALEKLTQELGLTGRVRFLGWLDEPLAAIKAADVYVVPSRHEPLGSVVLEGWVARRPMVAAASQGPRWLIEDGRTGLLVPIDAPQALAAALRNLLGDPALCARLAAAGRQAFEQGFTEEAAVRQYFAFFERLLAERRRP